MATTRQLVLGGAVAVGALGVTLFVSRRARALDRSATQVGGAADAAGGLFGQAEQLIGGIEPAVSSAGQFGAETFGLATDVVGGVRKGVKGSVKFVSTAGSTVGRTAKSAIRVPISAGKTAAGAVGGFFKKIF